MTATSVDLVFLDVWLPSMGGMEVLKRMREQFPDVGVIMISGHANISLAVQATKMGAFDFLEKPPSLDRTVTVARNAIRLEDPAQGEPDPEEQHLHRRQDGGASPA